MGLRRALDDYKRNRERADVFPGERRTQTGRFTGSKRRLVHVDPTGSIRDYSYPLSGFHGVTSSRFGVRVDGAVTWFDNLDGSSQTSREANAVVETVHELGTFDVVQRDFTDDLTHATAFEVDGETPESLEIVGFAEFSPEGESRIGQLVHDDEVVELYHDREHDYLAASTELTVTPEVMERFDEILADEPQSFPRGGESESYEGSRLTGGVSFRTALEGGRTTVVTTLSDIEERSRSESLARIADRTRRYRYPSQFLNAARQSTPSTDGADRLVETDLHVLDLLSAPTGARMAGPDFDPHYQYSGGYGYTWFRDDGEISTFLLEADERLGLDAEERHRKSARFYLRTQLADGRWPHRVWPRNGRLAPGWANGHVEGSETQYQADQTASVLVFLAEYLATHRDSLPAELALNVESALESGLKGMDVSLEADELPTVCENAWENANGRFTHTAAKFLHAYSAIAAAPLAAAVRDCAATRADRLYDALETMWSPGEGVYGLRLDDGELDARVDSTTFSLVDAHLAYAAVGDVDAERRRRLETHLETAFERLWTETDAIRGLRRFEGDTWRQRGQSSEKVWTVSTGWGAYAAEKAIRLFSPTDREFDPTTWADRLFAEIDLTGSLCLDSGYLPEQFFDSGTPDSATPLGWSHAIRLATYAARQSRGA
ncbi:glucan 1,4-alpha-glucosidase [Halomicroarcula limicola]|uniref:Glucan 1,4-alpha-glucosidase n=1 Tax=Haloarcula limicola TaxID=1429915 RepID=A0A8J7Y884_9EURY|nr:glycoside hydrolase family 15 protein [Halomicroarcula limicola]MBV0925912.1 glucan 1,4-alpha-glucosidase [Halomicroarcula limicola]